MTKKLTIELTEPQILGLLLMTGLGQHVFDTNDSGVIYEGTYFRSEPLAAKNAIQILEESLEKLVDADSPAG